MGLSYRPSGAGTWTIDVFGTGRGFNANEIVAGILTGGKVNFNLETGQFLIGNSITDYFLYWDGSSLKIKGDDIDLSANKEITSRVTKNQIMTDPEIQEILKGEEPILMIIKTSNGIIFKNNLINTVLTATLWQGGAEIDKDGSQYSYIWTKTDADGNPDVIWNQTHTYSSKSIAITQQDVFRRAQFECNIERIN